VLARPHGSARTPTLGFAAAPHGSDPLPFDQKAQIYFVGFPVLYGCIKDIYRFKKTTQYKIVSLAVLSIIGIYV
jgi:hypothetical protein